METLLYKPTDCQALLSLGRSKIYELIASKQLRTIRVGRSIRVPASALKEYVEQQQAQANQNS